MDRTGPPLNIVLHAPRIPQNAGQVARTCLAMGCRLHLVRPLGFRVEGPAMRRSAVGHLDRVDLRVHRDGADLWDEIGDAAGAWLITTRGRRNYCEAPYRPGDWLIFGSETEGLPPKWLRDHERRTLYIPMLDPSVRCLNLAASVAVVMFEALRRLGRLDGAPPVRKE